MYQCRDCGACFEVAETQKTKDFDEITVCPECKGDWFTEILETHCRCCGAKLPSTAVEYCNDYCMRRGEMMWEKERTRRKKEHDSPLHTMQRLLLSFNKKHHTRYSYGQFVTLILPKLTKEQLDEL